MCTNGPRHAVLIRLAARLAELVLRVAVLAGGVLPAHLNTLIHGQVPGALCTRLRLVAHPLCQGAGPGLVTVPLQLTVSTIVAYVTVLIQIVSGE